MTGTLTFYDAAWPPAHPPARDGVCGYIGGDTPHVWTAAESHGQTPATGCPFSSVPTRPGAAPAADVATAVARPKPSAPRMAHWSPGTPRPPPTPPTSAASTCTSPRPGTSSSSTATIRRDGNEDPDGLYWGADWTDTPHLHSGDQMTQYVSYPAYDE